MALNFFNPVFLFILVSFLNFPTIEAEGFSYLHHFCSENVTTANSTYQANRKTLFAALSSKATVKTFYNDTVGGTVYGLFMCRGDVPSNLCGQCVLNAAQTLSSECYLSTWAIIWYDECMVRYSNSSFFSNVETSPTAYFWSYSFVPNRASFRSLLNDTMNKTTNEAAFSPNGDRYATKEAKVSENQTLYCLAQCTRDQSPQYCSYCLAHAIDETPGCCGDKQGGRVLLPSCNIRYELFPFYQVNAPRQASLVPATKYSQPESNYLSRECSIHQSLYSDFEEKLLILLSHLSSSATSGSGNNGFYKTDVDGRVFGLYMCRLDIPPGLCGQCVVNATYLIASQCSSSSDAIVWYNHCLLRHSEQSFFNKMSTSPRFEQLNVTSVYDVESSFKFTKLSNTLAHVAFMTTWNNDDKYQTKSLVLNDNQTIYILAQCTRDLSAYDCFACLNDVVGSAIPWSRLGSVGGRVLYPSCTLRFELFKFYSDDIQVHAPPPPQIFPPHPSPATEKKGRSQVVILIVVSIMVSIILLLSSCYYLLRRKAKMSYKHILKENFGHESTTVESLQFDLAIIEAATNNFSSYNRIGKGGFGEVYKGVLHDGQHIAVKRLSTSSTQGVVEFKNEVLLIAKLQHRNLVAFIGFCLEKQEKILIYEYVPNKSLDYFLFGLKLLTLHSLLILNHKILMTSLHYILNYIYQVSYCIKHVSFIYYFTKNIADAHLENLLSWSERHKIIGGIARGILYLHEYSRLKVIHRDLKPSNVLLDENMNPKISDFGLAKIVEIDQQQGSTKKIVGTWGYMSPEYAMLGQFSEKSDVFSFGVMILEIISGKKNVGSYESHHIADGLLSLVWRQYKDQMPLSILDPKLKENCSTFEVIRCIQIGLLCVQQDPDDRPTMMTVVSYLSNHSMELPYPQEPALFLRRKMDSKKVVRESSSSSANKMSISNFLPR